MAPVSMVLERGATISDWQGVPYRYMAVEDTVLEADHPDATQGGDSGLLGGGGRTLLIQFLDLNRIVGPNRRITKAALKFIYTTGTPKFTAIKRVLQPWTEGPFRSVAGTLRGDDNVGRWAATFRNRRSGSDPIPWQISGARGDSDIEAIASAKAEVKEDTVTITGLEGAVQQMLSQGFANNGFAITFDDRVDFLSSNASEGRPQLLLETEEVPPATGADLSVVLIERSPAYDRYDTAAGEVKKAQDGVDVPMIEKVANPTAKKWPDEGEEVTYTAHVKNVGTAPAGAFEAQWLVRDVGNSIVTVSKALAPGEETTLDLKVPFRGSHQDHRVQPLALRLFPKAADAVKGNDYLEIHQGALNIGVAVEAALAEKLAQAGNEIGSHSVEDWLQLGVHRWNEVMSRYSRYSFAPEGALERVRIQKIEVFRDAPPADSLAYDGWIVLRDEADYLRQIGQACGLANLTTPLLRNGGETLADGIKTRPALDPFPGIMGGGDIRSDSPLAPTFAFPHDSYNDISLDVRLMEPGEALSATDVKGLNSNLGRRRGYRGDYLYDSVGAILVALTDMTGKRLANTEFTITQLRAGGFAGGEPIKLKTGESGSVVLPKRETGAPEGFYTATGHTPTANPFGRIDPDFQNGAFLIRATVNGVSESTVLKLWQALDAAARARQPLALLSVRLNVPNVPLADAPIAGTTIKVNGTAVTGDAPLNGATSVVELDLGKDTAVGQVQVALDVPAGKTVAYDVMIYGSGEKPDAARLYAREVNYAWNRTVQGDACSYRGLPQRGRTLRIVFRDVPTGTVLKAIQATAPK